MEENTLVMFISDNGGQELWFSKTQYDGKFMVELYDNDLNKVGTSKIDTHGEAHFSNLEMNNYYLNVLSIPEDSSEKPTLWALKKILIATDNTFFKIFAFVTVAD